MITTPPANASSPMMPASTPSTRKTTFLTIRPPGAAVRACNVACQPYRADRRYPRAEDAMALDDDDMVTSTGGSGTADDADHGADGGADAGAVDADHGADRGADAGAVDADHGADRGADAGAVDADHGADRGADAGAVDADHGADRGADAGAGGNQPGSR